MAPASLGFHISENGLKKIRLESIPFIMDNDALSNVAHRGVSMRTNADRLLVAVLSAIFLFASPWAAEAARTTIGKAFAVEGSSKVLHPGKPQEEDLKKQDPVALEDRVRTLPQSRAYVVLHDKSSFSLAQESIVFLNDFGVEQKATYFHGHVAKGLVRLVKKLRVTKPSSSYVITTPTALIAVEPTDEEADFLVEVLSELQTNLTVLHGKVRLKNIVEEIPGERMLEAGQTALVVAGKEPSSVFQSTKEGMEGLVQSSTIPGTLPTDNIPEVTPPSPEPGPQPPAPQPIPPPPGPAPEPPGPEPTPVPPEPWPPEPPSPWPPGPWPPGPWPPGPWPPPAPIPQPVCPCPAGLRDGRRRHMPAVCARRSVQSSDLRMRVPLPAGDIRQCGGWDLHPAVPYPDAYRQAGTGAAQPQRDAECGVPGVRVLR